MNRPSRLFRFGAVPGAIVLMFGSAWAQDKPASDTLDTVVVTGVRAARQLSLDTKKNADTNVEVISAEDVGKMPDKNIADALRRVPGVTVSATSAGQFDESERVSVRGGGANRTLTLVNGHGISGGDWHIGDQFGAGNRSVGFALLPSELVSQVLVYKSAQADLTEGGLTGTVDIVTRSPLQFKKSLTLDGSVGLVYSDLAGKAKPQLSALVNWKNEAKTFGVMLQAFSEERARRRDSQEFLGWGTVDAGSALAAAHPDLANARFPEGIGTTLFEGKNKRTGGMLVAEIQPTADLKFKLSSMRSKQAVENTNTNHMAVPGSVDGPAGPMDTGDDIPGIQYTVSPRTHVITSLKIPNLGADVIAEETAQYIRKGAHATVSFTDLEASWQATPDLAFTARGGTSRGVGETPREYSVEVGATNTGLSYMLHGGSPADIAYSNYKPSTFPSSFTIIDDLGESTREVDRTRYGQVDGKLQLDGGWLSALKFGLRASRQERGNFVSKPVYKDFDTLSAPPWISASYPGNFGTGLSGNFARNDWQISSEDLARWAEANVDFNLTRNEYPFFEYHVTEKTASGYAMAEYALGNTVSGNFGLRVVRTDDDVLVYKNISTAVCPALSPCPAVPGAITTSRFRSYAPNLISHGHTDLLPSINLRYEAQRDLIARFGLNRTLARPGFADLGHTIYSVSNGSHTASGGNPDLPPTTADNADLSLAWYFAPRGLLSVGVFASKISNYTKSGVTPVSLVNETNGKTETYQVTAPVPTDARLHGLELDLQQPIGAGFGLDVNATWISSRDSAGLRMTGQSRSTYNLGAYYENDRFSARLAYNWRASSVGSYNADGSQASATAAYGTVSASLQYKLSEQLSLSLDGLNLNNPIARSYYGSNDEPGAFRVNGRQYYLNLRFSY